MTRTMTWKEVPVDVKGDSFRVTLVGKAETKSGRIINPIASKRVLKRILGRIGRVNTVKKR